MEEKKMTEALKEKAGQVKDSIGRFFNRQRAKAEIWWSRNKDWAVIVIPMAATAIGSGIKFGVKEHQLKKEENMKYMTCWDAKEGHRWELNRKPSSKEWNEIDRRKADGERLGDILEDMKMVK